MLPKLLRIVNSDLALEKVSDLASIARLRLSALRSGDFQVAGFWERPQAYPHRSVG